MTESRLLSANPLGDSPFDQQAVEDEVFLSASGNIVGLFEIIQMLNEELPSTELSKKYRVAEQAVRSLLRSGFIRLYQFCPSDEAETTALNASEAEAAVTDPACWHPSSYDLGKAPFYIAAETTDRGEEELDRRGMRWGKEKLG